MAGKWWAWVGIALALVGWGAALSAQLPPPIVSSAASQGPATFLEIPALDPNRLEPGFIQVAVLVHGHSSEPTVIIPPSGWYRMATTTVGAAPNDLIIDTYRRTAGIGTETAKPWTWRLAPPGTGGAAPAPGTGPTAVLCGAIVGPNFVGAISTTRSGTGLSLPETIPSEALISLAVFAQNAWGTYTVPAPWRPLVQINKAGASAAQGVSQAVYYLPYSQQAPSPTMPYPPRTPIGPVTASVDTPGGLQTSQLIVIRFDPSL